MAQHALRILPLVPAGLAYTRLIRPEMPLMTFKRPGR